MAEEHLRALGFTENETRAYLSLAEIGKGGASLIAKRINIPRTTAYSVLDSLVGKGVVSIEHKQDRALYSANKPMSLLRMLEKERDELVGKVNCAKELVNIIKPYFKGKHFSVPKIQFFEGRENVESLLYDYTDVWYEELANYNSKIVGFQDHTFVAEYRTWLEWSWERKPEDIGVSLLSNHDPNEREFAGKVPGREIRPISSEITFTSSIWVIGPYIALIMTQQEPHYAFQIRDSVFADNLRSVFELLWAQTS